MLLYIKRRVQLNISYYITTIIACQLERKIATAADIAPHQSIRNLLLNDDMNSNSSWIIIRQKYTRNEFVVIDWYNWKLQAYEFQENGYINFS